jgi:hypothetical protein
MNIFEPNRIRYTLWFLLYYAIAWYFFYMGWQVLSGNEVNLAFFLQTSLGLLVIAFIGAIVIPAVHPKFMRITILGKTITGPSLWLNRPVGLNLNMLDIEKSQRRNTFHTILGFRLIVSTSGEKILFSLFRCFEEMAQTALKS